MIPSPPKQANKTIMKTKILKRSKSETKSNLPKGFADRNKLFKAASAAEKRVMIAKDVLAHLKKGKIIASQGNWAEIRAAEYLDENEQLCSVIANKDTTCQCCALGALMIAEIGINDKLKVKEASDYGDYRISLSHQKNWPKELITETSLELGRYQGDRLSKYFSEQQLRCIEAAFESGGGYYPMSSINNCAAAENVVSFAGRVIKKSCGSSKKWHRYSTGEQTLVLVAIMKNIVKNKGTFVP